MLYLITFDHDVFTSPLSVGELLVKQQDEVPFDQLTFAHFEDPIHPDNVLQPALRNGFAHPDGLVVDASLVDIMSEPHVLEEAGASQLKLEAQLDELKTEPTSVQNAPFEREQDQIARDARLDHDEALNSANTARRDLLARPVNDELQRHWDAKGS
ncbi:MAG TPA: hypothetical protein H9884_01630 [Candidatus Yaniella excrementigallinarum]|nr:hypothetical protein [Candidatus Yaniella excrementigallinarum]